VSVTSTRPASGPAAQPGLPLWVSAAGLRRLTVAEYHALIRMGIVAEHDEVVLIEGCLVHKMPKNLPHILTLRRLRRLLDQLMPSGWTDWTQDPVTLADSEPEPDYAVVRGTDADYTGRKPGPADIGLVVEVADSSLAVDRADSHRIYARAGVPEYWIVNIPDRQVEVYTLPQPAADPPAYAARTDYRPGEAVPVVLDGTTVGTVAVADVLP
jgi:Uma2 family endonuclease